MGPTWSRGRDEGHRESSRRRKQIGVTPQLCLGGSRPGAPPPSPAQAERSLPPARGAGHLPRWRFESELIGCSCFASWKVSGRPCSPLVLNGPKGGAEEIPSALRSSGPARLVCASRCPRSSVRLCLPRPGRDPPQNRRECSSGRPRAAAGQLGGRLALAPGATRLCPCPASRRWLLCPEAVADTAPVPRRRYHGDSNC